MRIPSSPTARYGPPFGLLLTWAAIDAAVAIYLRVYGANIVSTTLLLAGLVLFGITTYTGRTSTADIRGLALILLGAHLAIAVVSPFRAEAPPPSDLFRVFPAIGLVAILAAAVVSRRGPLGPAWTWALWIAIAAGFLDRIAIVATDVWPPFDVPLIQQAAGQALLRASDPYLTFIYDSGYPYLPLAAIAGALGELAGDARWANVIGDAMTVAGILLFARRAGASRSLAITLAALWTWWAGALYVTWQGFSEPLLIGLSTLGAAALAGPAPRTAIGGVVIGLAAATKQFGLGLIPFLVTRPWPGRRAAATALITWAIVVIPFALWHPPEFMEGAFLSHLREPGRPYALNLLTWPGITLDVGFVLVAPVVLAFGWLCQRRIEAPLAAWLVGSTGLLLLAFLLNRIAFVNYYAIPLALLLLLMLAFAPRPEATTEARTEATTGETTA